MRGKFSGPCVPDPSVPRIVVTAEWLDIVKKRLPEMPVQKANRFSKEYGLTPEEAAGMSQERDVSEFFEDVVGQKVPARKVANWMTTYLIPALRDRNQTIRETYITEKRFAAMIAMLESGVINAHAAKEVLLQLLSSDESPDEIVEKGHFRQVSDTTELDELIDRILADHPSDVGITGKETRRSWGFSWGLQ